MYVRLFIHRITSYMYFMTILNCSGYITILLEYIIFLYTYEYCIVHITERKFNVEVGNSNPAMIIICITDDRGYYARSLLGSVDYRRKSYSVRIYIYRRCRLSLYK